MAALSTAGKASNLGEWLQLAAWDIAAIFGDRDAASHAAALREVNSQATPTDRYIYNVVESEIVEGPKIPIFSDLKDMLGDTIEGVGGLVKNLPLMIFAVIAFLGIYLILLGKKGKVII